MGETSRGAAGSASTGLRPRPVVDVVLLGILPLAVGAGLSTIYPAVGTPGMPPLSGDALQYLNMVTGLAPVEQPFAYRIAVPALVSILPFEPSTGFKCVTWAGLWLGWCCVVIGGRHLGLTRSALAFGGVAASMTAGFANHFHNPYLTDGAGLAFVCFGVLSWQFDVLACAVVAVVVGSLVRESTVQISLLWAASRSWGRAGIVAALGLVVVAGVRSLPGMPSSQGFIDASRHVWEVKGPVRVLEDALGTWHVFYVLALLGARRALPPARSTLRICLAVLVGSGVLLSLVAVNTNRMLTYAWPAMVLGTAALFDEVPRIRRLLIGLFLILVPGLLSWFPNRLSGASLLGPLPRAMFGVALVGWLVALLWAIYGKTARERWR